MFSHWIQRIIFIAFWMCVYKRNMTFSSMTKQCLFNRNYLCIRVKQLNLGWCHVIQPMSYKEHSVLKWVENRKYKWKERKTPTEQKETIIEKNLFIINHHTNYNFTVAPTRASINMTIIGENHSQPKHEQKHTHTNINWMLGNQTNVKRVKCKIYNNYRFYAWNAERFLCCCWQNVIPGKIGDNRKRKYTNTNEL